MRVQDFSGKGLEYILAEINHDINLLYVIPCIYTRNLVLNHLRDRISMVEAFTGVMGQPLQMQMQTQAPTHQETAVPDQAPATPVQQMTQGNQTTFTLQELSKFDGKGGNPAYVAVNGIVYDVTNNAAWAAATHFGLTAGKDLTNEFASCHAGQPILNKLRVVGMLQ